MTSMGSVTLSVDPDDPVLPQLCGGSSAEIELGRQSFIRQWNEFNFRVKTFQESVIPSFADADERAAAVSDRQFPAKKARDLTNAHRPYVDLQASSETLEKRQQRSGLCITTLLSFGRWKMWDTKL